MADEPPLPIMCPAIGPAQLIRLDQCILTACWSPTYRDTAWCKEHLEELREG